MNRTAKLFYSTGSILLLIGMAWGLHMAGSHDHTMAPAHAHLNLAGAVLSFIFGTFYALVPAAAAKPVARVHWGLHTVAVVIFAPGIALANMEKTEALAIIGSLLVFASMILFTWTVFRTKATA